MRRYIALEYFRGRASFDLLPHERGGTDLNHHRERSWDQGYAVA